MVAASPHSLSHFFLHVVQSALGGTLVNSLLRFTVCCTDIGLSGITKTKAISTFMVPNKGAIEHLVKAVVDFMSGCGCGRAILKRDGEPATVALQEASKNPRQSATIPENSPKRDSQQMEQQKTQ